MRIAEQELILPALYIIRREGGANTTQLIQELTALFHPTGEDAAILAGRNDTKFSQKVRNLKSHRESNGMAEYTDLSPAGVYTLTAAGEACLEENLEQVEYLFSNAFEDEEVLAVVRAIESTPAGRRRVIVYREEDMVSEGRLTRRETAGRTRSQRLRTAALEHYRGADGAIRCTVCGFCFAERYGELGEDFAEFHHERPVYQYEDEGMEEYLAEAVERIKPLCANCHRMIHRNPRRPLTIRELEARLR